MKYIPAVLATLLIAGCQQSHDASTAKTAVSPPSLPTSALVIDVSTPDRALKSYWQAKDAYRKAEFDWSAAQVPEVQKLKSKIGYDAAKLMAGDVLSAHQEMDKPGRSQFEEFSREIVDIKQDTESRATAMVRVKNSTPVPDGVVVSDSDKKQREEGEQLKYILEKDSGGWKIAQVYQYSKTNIILHQEPWQKVFSAPTARGYANVYVNQFLN